MDFSPVVFVWRQNYKIFLYYMSAGHCSLHIILFLEFIASPDFYFQNVPAVEARWGVQSSGTNMK